MPYLKPRRKMFVHGFVLISCLIICVASGQDPSTVCQPAQIQVSYYNFINNTFGLLSVDFVRNMFVRYDATTQLRTVYDFYWSTAFVITQDNQCTKEGISLSDMIFQCLPGIARKISPNNTYMGYGMEKMDVQTWQIDIIENISLRVSFTSGASPVIPLFRHVFNTQTGSPLSLVVFTNSSLQVDPSQFYVPPSCY